MQNRATRGINLERDRSVGMSAETLSLQTQISPKLQLISITDTKFGLETNLFCNHFGYNGK